MSDGQPSNLSNYVAAVEAENDMLRERIRQLEEMLGVTDQVPLLFGLSGREGALLNLLVSQPIVTKEGALSQMYFDRPNDVPELKIIDVFICKIRKKLEPFGIKIDTMWGARLLHERPRQGQSPRIRQPVQGAGCVTILHSPEYLKKARQDVATMFDIAKFTCDDCPDQAACPFVFDVYNQDGDCLAEK